MLLLCAFGLLALTYSAHATSTHQPISSSNATATAADNEPFWHKSMRQHASEDGYRLLALDKLNDLPPKALLLDVRPDYEFQNGHIPDAVNFEFDPGDSDNISAQKSEQLKQILGPDMHRMIVIYCRSFRCLRSGVAAKAAARLGYTNVWRVAEGYYGWLDAGDPQKGTAHGRCDNSAQIAVRRLPDHGLAILGGDEDRQILGLGTNVHTARLEDIRCDVLVVLFFNTHCIQCREQMTQLEELTRKINTEAKEKSTHTPALLVAIGVHESKRTLAAMRHKQINPIPLFADPDSALFAASGFAGIPAAWIIGPTDANRREILLAATGDIAANPDFRGLLFRMTGVPAWGIEETATPSQGTATPPAPATTPAIADKAR